jgi:hypothetical protein
MRSFKPTQRVHVCAYCNKGVTHIIDPNVYKNDVIAERQEKGWKCGNCIEMDIQKKIAESKKRRGVS